MKSRPYSDWFGEGDLKDDIENTIKAYGDPLAIFSEYDGYMAALVYKDKVICVGYDGFEYQHRFILTQKETL